LLGVEVFSDSFVEPSFLKWSDGVQAHESPEAEFNFKNLSLDSWALDFFVENFILKTSEKKNEGAIL